MKRKFKKNKLKLKKVYQENKKLKKIKAYIGYIGFHPSVIIKGVFVLFFDGPKEFLDKLIRIENRLKVKKTVQGSIFSQIKHWIKIVIKIFINICVRFFPAILYFIINFIFFTIFKLFFLILTPFSKKLVIDPNKRKIDGISFIIPTWNKKDMVVECVLQLDKVVSSENKNIPMEIIVVDNGSKDNTNKALTNLKTITPLRVIRSEANLGFAKGINLGVNESRFNYIYLINNDMLAKNGLINELIIFGENLLDKNKLFFGLSSQIFFFDPTKRREESGKNYYHPDFGYLYVAHCVNNYNLQTPSITGYPGGGSSLINKDLFLKLGGYDKDLYLPLYDEDLDLGFIAWKFGFPSYFVPSSQIIHHHRSSSKKLRRDPNYYMFKNWLTFILKNYDSLSLILKHIFFYPLRMLHDQRFVDYAWENTKIIHKILYKKIILSRYKRVHKDSELINFPKFEFKFNNNHEE